MEKEIPTIPKFLNQPDRIAFWTWNELILFLSITVIASILYSLILGFILGALGVRFMHKLQNSPYGDLTKIGMYWFSPWSKNRFKYLPAAYIREYIG